MLACGPGTSAPGPEGGSSSGAGPTSDLSADDGGVASEPACDDHPALTASWTAWRAAADSHHDTYFYSVRRALDFYDWPEYCVYHTLVAVVEGRVVERRFTLVDSAGDLDCDPDFIEKGDEIGTHNTGMDAPAVTFDALYVACCDTVIHIEPSDEYRVTFGIDEAGLMRACSYEMIACGEFCFGGPLGDVLNVVGLEFGVPPPP